MSVAEGDRARQLAVAIVDAWPYMGDGVSIGNDAELRELRLSEITDYVRGTLDTEVAERVGALDDALSVVREAFALIRPIENMAGQVATVDWYHSTLYRVGCLLNDHLQKCAALATAGAPGSQEDGRG